jgi:hypothetical protein
VALRIQITTARLTDFTVARNAMPMPMPIVFDDASKHLKNRIQDRSFASIMSDVLRPGL